MPRPTPDPMPAAELGTWLFVAAESMFFAGLMVAFLVLRRADPPLFARSAAVVSRPATVTAIALLAASLAVLAVNRGRPLAITAALAVAFLSTQAWAAAGLLTHHTLVTATAVYDGRVTPGSGGQLTIAGTRRPVTAGFDIVAMTPDDSPGTDGTFAVPAAARPDEADYGPSRNAYFACWFLFVAAHAVHVVGGLVAIAWLSARRRFPAASRSVRLYWRFVTVAGLVGSALLWRG